MSEATLRRWRGVEERGELAEGNLFYFTSMIIKDVIESMSDTMLIPNRTFNFMIDFLLS